MINEIIFQTMKEPNIPRYQIYQIKKSPLDLLLVVSNFDLMITLLGVLKSTFILFYCSKIIVYRISIYYMQGRQSVPKSSRSERGGERNFGVAPKNVLLKGYFYPNFRGGAEKVVVHMHWLTWLLWRHCS